MFIAGGVSGFFLAQPSTDIMLHATYFVVGHFHLVMGVAAMFGIFAGTYFWFPKMYGRMMNETLGKTHFWLSFVGAYAIFMPFHYLGLAGNVRRYQALRRITCRSSSPCTNSLPSLRCLWERHSSSSSTTCFTAVSGARPLPIILAGDVPGMEHAHHAAATQQFWRQTARSLSRPLSVRSRRPGG